jgi:hypothetical protein
MVNTSPWQQQQAPTSTITRTLLDNSPLNTSLNNGEILGIGAFLSVCTEAIQ